MIRDRRTKIVATVGPSSSDEERLLSMVNAGADVLRFNFSHGTPEDHAKRYEMVKRIEDRLKRPVGVFADLQGPKLRLGNFAEGEVTLRPGDAFRLDLDQHAGDNRRAPLPHPQVFEALKPGAMLLINDGRVRLRVTACAAEWAETVVVVGGPVSNHKGVNLPDVALAISPLTPKDREDLDFALSLGISMVALSFVQRRGDLDEARAITGDRARLIAKLEKPSAIDDLTAIIARSDAVMVARGDLGVEMRPEDVPAVQKRIIRLCRSAGCPVIVATQMLESMISAPTPTRAEASDVANAVYEGVDAVMLSGESAAGQYPLEAVTMMDRIISRTERDPWYHAKIDASDMMPETTDADAISAAARSVAETCGATAIATYTTTGGTSLRVARTRPPVPVLALTPVRHVANNLTLTWGSVPIEVPKLHSFEELIDTVTHQALASGVVQSGERIVVTAGLPLDVPGTTNALHIIQIPASATTA